MSKKLPDRMLAMFGAEEASVGHRQELSDQAGCVLGQDEPQEDSAARWKLSQMQMHEPAHISDHEARISQYQAQAIARLSTPRSAAMRASVGPGGGSLELLSQKRTPDARKPALFSIKSWFGE
eukprot:3804926-Rhodomonas_salina.1